MATTRARTLLLPAAALAVILAISSVGVSARQGLLGNLLQNVLRLLPGVTSTVVNPVLGLLQPVLHLLTNDLVAQLVSAPDQPARIIMRGNVTQLLGVAARHGLPVHRTLDEFIVTSA